MDEHQNDNLMEVNILEDENLTMDDEKMRDVDLNDEEEDEKLIFEPKKFIEKLKSTTISENKKKMIGIFILSMM